MPLKEEKIDTHVSLDLNSLDLNYIYIKNVTVKSYKMHGCPSISGIIVKDPLTMKTWFKTETHSNTSKL